MPATKCINQLQDEHRIILRALFVLEAMGQRAKAGEMPPSADVQSLLEFLKTFADDQHQGKEESILFPVFLQAWDKSRLEVVSHMIFEHNQERSLTEGLEDALFTQNGKDFSYYAIRLVRILSNHIYKEDHILFSMIDRTLSTEDDAKVCAGFEEADAPNILRRNRLLHQLRDLEWQYLGKTAQRIS